MFSHFSVLTLGIFAFSHLGCTDGSSAGGRAPGVSNSGSPKPSPTSGAIVDNPGNSTTSNSEICSELTADSSIPADFSALAQRLCQKGTIESLRAKAYTGSGDPDLGMISKELSGAKTEVKTTSLMIAQSSAKSYFNLTKLQVSKPDEFKQQGFETNSDVTYQILSQNENRVAYSYRNAAEAPEIYVEYDAEANFIDFGSGKLFVVTTKVTKPKESVREFRGISVIYSGNGKNAEVYSVSDQLYDNNNSHKTAVLKFKNRGSLETTRSFRNSKNASRADSFFK